MRWQSGQNDIDDMLEAGDLERCSASVAEARILLADGGRFLAQLRSRETTDAAVRFRLAFRAMASIASALLAAQGLRQTSAGGLTAVQRAVNAQFRGGPGPGVFDALTTMSVQPTDAADAADLRAAAERSDEATEGAAWAVAYGARLLDANVLHAFSGEKPSEN